MQKHQWDKMLKAIPNELNTNIPPTKKLQDFQMSNLQVNVCKVFPQKWMKKIHSTKLTTEIKNYQK